MNRIPKYLLLLFVFTITAPSQGQIAGFEKVKWKKERIARGLQRVYSHTLLEDTIPQNINILVVDQSRRSISLVYDPEENVQTSKLAERSAAKAAVNAGFFSIREHGSLTYIKVRGRVVDTDTAARWPRVANMTGSIIIDTTGTFSIISERTNGWYDSCLACRDVLVTGPLLVHNGQKATLPETSLVLNRHPRTCAGIRRDGRILLVTVDGRTAESQGMTLMKMAALMVSLGCTEAVNLDGGGSTTMWIKGRPSNGVVNMPSDNRIFDHEGERPVANILVVR